MAGIFSKIFPGKKKNSKEESKNTSDHLENIKKQQSEKFKNAAVAFFKKKDYSTSYSYFKKAFEYNKEDKDLYHNLKVVKQKMLQQKKEEEKAAASAKQQANNSNTNAPLILDANTADPNFLYKILRIDRDSSKEEIQERIAYEFKKWRTKVNSPDRKKRFEAEEMLSIIARAKRELI